MPQRREDVLYFIICGGQPAEGAHELVKLAQADGWDVCVITTPQGARFVDTERLAAMVRYPVRSDYKWPGDPDVLPQANAIVAAPLTFNTLNKWALGITDTLAVSLLCEYLGLEVPIVAAPNINPALARHPIMRDSILYLRELGVRLLYEPSARPPTWMVGWSEIVRELR